MAANYTLKSVNQACRIDHVSQLGSVRGVPGAVGAAGGLGAAALTFFFKGEVPTEVFEVLSRLALSVVGGFVMETGYRVAGPLGKRNQKDLQRDMAAMKIDGGVKNALEEMDLYFKDLITFRLAC